MRNRISRQRLLLLGLSMLVLAPLAGELAFRLLLFDQGRIGDHGWRLRRPELYAHHRSDPDYWKLHWLFESRGSDPGPANRDAEIGWLANEIEPGTCRHVQEGVLRGRRPILMYGDSFTACLVPREECWEGLLSDSPWAEDHLLLNYGSCAHGLDQAYLVLQRSLPRFAGERPIVIFGILVDDDLDRCVLAIRQAPKPWFELEGEEGLVPVHPGLVRSTRRWLEENPPAPRSYLWRWLRSSLRQRFGRIVPESEASIAHKQELARRILAGIRREIEAAGVEAFFLLFHGQEWLDDRSRQDWREDFLVKALRELSLPWVSSRLALQADQDRSGRASADYFLQGGIAHGHYNALGNRAVFEALLAGLAGRYDG